MIILTAIFRHVGLGAYWVRLMTGMVDLHSHHLPGVDDGPRTLADAVAQVRQLGDLGYQVLVATPHVIQGRFDYRLPEIAERVAALQEAVGSTPVLLAGAELRFDAGFLEMLDNNELIPLGGQGNLVLVEFAWPRLPTNLLDALYRIQLRGYRPLLAHPDRYECEEEDFERLALWVERGGLLQIELGSLAGRYGSRARAAARRLLADGLVSVAAADVHGTDDVEALARAGLAALEKRVGSDEARRLCVDRPAELLAEAA